MQAELAFANDLVAASLRSPLQASTWELFGDAVLAGLCLAAALPLVGMLLVLRRQVFLCAAIGQSGGFGIAFGLWLVTTAGGSHLHFEAMTGYVPLLVGCGVGVAAAWLALRQATGAAAGPANHPEARAAWLFLVGGSGAMVLLADAPHGLQMVQQLMLSSLLGANATDLWLAVALLAGLATAVWCWPRPLALWAIDPLSARVYGANMARLDLLVALAIGTTLAFAIHVAGLPFAFATAILPVLAARELAGSLRTVAWLAPLLGAGGFAIGWWWATAQDLPPGQCAVLTHAAVAGLARVLRRG
jgi:ABC-type Mn2+/Zn2+ transport system permease subunit